jgi:hypothetical protein
MNTDAAPAPFTRSVIVGSVNSLGALSPQTVGGSAYNFRAWSDGGAASHDVVASTSATTLTAMFDPAVDATGGPLLTSGAVLASVASPALTDFSIEPRRFRSSRLRKAPRRGEAPLGTSIRYTLSQAATVTIKFERLVGGKRYVSVSRRIRGARAPKSTTCRATAVRQRRRLSRSRACTIVTPDSFALRGRLGLNKSGFSGGLGGFALSPGNYRATISIGAQSQSGAGSRQARFVIVT